MAFVDDDEVEEVGGIVAEVEGGLGCGFGFAQPAIILCCLSSLS
jgi:hypothetical protein